ncbi:MAG: phage replication initiation protein, NGO0469 family [Phycisphaerales bacterium]
MALKLKASSIEGREMTPAGTYKALLMGIFDIGTQQGQYGPKRQCVVQWELHKKGLEKPYQMSKWYGLSFNVKSKLRIDMEAMLGRTFKDGEEFDLESLLEKPCRIQVVQGSKADGSPRDEIKSLMPLDDDDAPPKAVGNTVYFEISGPGCDIPSDVPKFVAEKIRSAPEWTGHAADVGSGNGAKAAVVDPDDDDPPF